ncbi:putative cell wall-binding protein/beta-lactamase class A [Mycetocola sp. CAN_C7]|uniref:serine hydrolase n=1 Tax=Mycetocola sp. CAN_C7 TaxID=2787724 RepID=UPI0018CA80C5
MTLMSEDGSKPTAEHHRRHSRGVVTATLAVLAAAALVIAPLTTSIETASGVAKTAANPTISRIGGTERTSSAIAVSKSAYPNGAPVVYLGSSVQFADNFAAGPVAAAADAPLLLSTPTSISTPTVTEIRRLGAQKIVVVGDASEISDAVVNALRSKVAPDVSRIGIGSTSAESARNIVASGFPTAATALIVSRQGWSGVISAMAAAAQLSSPVIPVDGTAATLDQATKDHLSTLGVTRAVIVGGTSAVSSGVETAMRTVVPTVERAAGADQYAVSISLNKLLFPAASRAYLASGYDYSEALGVASLAAVRPGPVFMAQPTCVPDVVRAEIVQRTALTAVALVGSTKTLGTGPAGLVACSTANTQTKAASEKALVNKLNAAMPGLPGAYNVSAFEAGGLKRAVSVRGGTAAEPASSIKLFAAYAAMKRIDQGRLYYSTKLSSGYTLAQCLRAMIHISDNYCHSDIIKLIGANTMNAIFASEGYTATHYAGTWKGKYYSYKTSSTNDLTTLLLRLNSGTLLSKASSDFMLKLMKEQFWKSRIGSAIPSGVGIATKPGELWVSSGMTQIDAGLVYSPAGTYSVVIMGYKGATKAGVARLARVVYEHFNGVIGKVATYPIQQLTATATTAVRSSAGGAAMFTIAAGTHVEALDSVRLWYRVIANGRTGYVSSSYLANRY